MVAPMLDKIRDEGMSELDNSIVSYWSVTDNAYVFLAKYPVPADTKIPAADASQSQIKIKLRQ